MTGPKRKANENLLTIASMDNEQVYGPEFHRLGFGRAIELGILSQYKVVIFNVDQEQVGIDLDSLLSDGTTDINMDNAARMVGCWNGLGKRGASGFDFTTDLLPAKRAVAFSNTINQSRQFFAILLYYHRRLSQRGRGQRRKPTALPSPPR